MFPMVFPLVFASSAFVDTSFMPGWLQAFANHLPTRVGAGSQSRLNGGYSSVSSSK